MISEKPKPRFSPNAVILITVFVDVTGFGIILPLLPYYAVMFQAGSTALGLLVASFALMQFISSPMLGRLSDRVGRRPVLLFSIVTSVGSFVLFALADSFVMLLLSRIVAGLATEVGVAQAYIADITGDKERATGMGRVGAAHGAGFIIGPALGGFLSVYGFSAAGFAAAALALVNLAFAFFFLPESKVHTYAKEEMSSRSRRLGGFVKAAGKPLMGSVMAILFITSFVFSSFPVIMPLLAISFFNLSSFDMSFFFVYTGLVQIVFQGFVVGRLASKVGEERLMPLGSLLMTLGILFMCLLPNIAVFLTLATVMVLGRGILGTSIPSFISKTTSADKQGSVLGVAQSVSSIARVPGPLVGGLVFEFAGLVAPFFLGALMLTAATLLGVRVGFQGKERNH